MKSFQWHTARSIVSGPGSLSYIKDYIAEQQVSSVFVVTDMGIINAGLLGQLETVLEESGVSFSVFDQVVADPPEATVLACATQAASSNADLVIGYGGGSPMDTAKLVAVLMNGDQPITDMYGVDQVVQARKPLILVPTTAGTGSEVTPVAIVTTGETTKSGVVSKQLLPDLAILDADLTVGLPSHITAATGIDAMVHAIEAYTTKHKKNPLSDAAALQALALLSGNIVEATQNGSSLEARGNMLLGACLAGQAFANAPVAAVHALAYPLGGRHHIAHGLSNSLVLIEVLKFNRKACQGMYAELAKSLDGCAKFDNEEQQVDAFIRYFEQLIDTLRLPTTLSQLDIVSDPAVLAEDAMLQQRLLVNNRRDVSLNDALAIYRAIL